MPKKNGWKLDVNGATWGHRVVASSLCFMFPNNFPNVYVDFETGENAMEEEGSGHPHMRKDLYYKTEPNPSESTTWFW